MKKILLAALALIVVALAVLAVIISMQPDEYEVERTATIDAPAGVVYEQVEDVRRWSDWAPWVKRIPEDKGQHGGADRGEGATYEWSSEDRDVGTGQMTILEANPGEYIEIKLEFFEPYESTTTTSFDFVAVDDDTTEVTWRMTGDNNFLSKAMSLFLNIEEMIGEDYEKGLANLDEHSRNVVRDAQNTESDDGSE